MEKKIAVLGSTGSVGTQALDVAEKRGFAVTALCAGADDKTLEAQVRRFRPSIVGMRDREAAKRLKIALCDLDCTIVDGENAASVVAELADATIAVNAVTGIAGLSPTVSALKSGKDVALANKETMVAWGDGVMALAREKGRKVLPVDSEHCAIFQCLRGNETKDVARLLITASGGPFYRRSREELSRVTPEMALAHPTWKMGRRITIDSATLMNKGFEVIEAVRLFGVRFDQVSVLIHPESIVHSMVEYADHAVMAQLSVPDMRLCVQYALEYPERRQAVIDRLDLGRIGALHFEDPDLERFPLLALAWEAMEKGGVTPACVNAADETAVSLFLDGKIGFDRIAKIVLSVAQRAPKIDSPTLDDVFAADVWARECALSCAGV